jgi:uncharacterized membrane protein YgcG
MNTGQLMGSVEKKGFLYASEAKIVARRRIALAKAEAKERARVNALANAAGGRINTSTGGPSGQVQGWGAGMQPPDLGRQESSATKLSTWSQGTTASPRSQFDGSNSDRTDGNRVFFSSPGLQDGHDFGDQFQGNPHHPPPVGFARKEFHGTSLESIREDTKNAAKWAVPGLKALQLDRTNGNGSWVQVLGYKLDGKMVTYVMQEMPYTAQDKLQPSFGWTPYQLAGAFLAAEMQFGRLPPPAVLGSVQDQQERSQTQQLIDGLTASIVGANKRQRTDPEGGWNDDLQGISDQIEKHSLTSSESLAAIMSLTDGKEILTLIRWLSRCKSFEAVERKVPRHASILERQINSYNDTWKTSWTVLTVMRLLSFNWKLVTEDDLVAGMVAGQATAAESEEMGITVDSGGQFVIKQVAKGAKAKGGFTSCQIVKDIWVHLHNLFRMGFGITGAHALVPPLDTLVRQLMLATLSKVKPQKTLWLRFQRDVPDAFATYVMRSNISPGMAAHAGFALYSPEELVTVKNEVQADYNTYMYMQDQFAVHMAAANNGGNSGASMLGELYSSPHPDTPHLSSARARQRQRARDRRQAEVDANHPGNGGGGGAYGVDRNDNGRVNTNGGGGGGGGRGGRGGGGKGGGGGRGGGGGKAGGGKGGDGRSRRPHWIPIDEDWAVVTGYGVGSYKEAVNKWRDSGADITSDTCFWKAHGRECMNNSCPACKRGSQ